MMADTVDDYEEYLLPNLRGLLDRLHRGAYRPQPSLRRDIPKGDGRTRPLGIATVNDKIVQRAIVMILERIYEVDFRDTSYGFRPNRSCHQALSALGQIIGTTRVNWIFDADIRGFFDNVCHDRLVELLRLRIADPKLLRLIVRFLNAGVSPPIPVWLRVPFCLRCWRTFICIAFWTTGSNAM